MVANQTGLARRRPHVPGLRADECRGGWRLGPVAPARSGLRRLGLGGDRLGFLGRRLLGLLGLRLAAGAPRALRGRLGLRLRGIAPALGAAAAPTLRLLLGVLRLGLLGIVGHRILPEEAWPR